MLLDGIIGEVDGSILEVLGRELLGGRPYVPLLVPVSSDVSVSRRHQDVATNVELPFVVEEGHQVSLDDVGARLSVGPDSLRVDDCFHFLHRVGHFYPTTLIGVFSRLDNPQLPPPPPVALLLFDECIFLFVVILHACSTFTISLGIGVEEQAPV
jgi:hypothetical protein